VKRRLFQLLAVVFAIYLFLPTNVSAAGGYVASRKSDVYHCIDCFYVDRIAEENLVFYKTVKEAERARKRGCMKCNPEYTGSDFRVGKTSRWTSSDPKTQSKLEDEYKGGYSAGYEKGEKAGYNIGYEDGLVDGARQERSDLYEELERKEKASFWSGVSFSFFVALPILSIVIESLPKKKDKATIMREELFQKYGIPDSPATKTVKTSKVSAPNINQMTYDESSVFSFIDYRDTVLILVFKSGGEYHYYDVPKSIYEDLLSAPSKGRYYHEHIKDQYPYF
jgi:hypothetical protein